jgi:hypothetical protein
MLTDFKSVQRDLSQKFDEKFEALHQTLDAICQKLEIVQLVPMNGRRNFFHGNLPSVHIIVDSDASSISED